MSQLHRLSGKKGLFKSRTLRKISSRKVSISSKDFLELVYSPTHSHARNSPIPSLRSPGNFNIPSVDRSPVNRKSKRRITFIPLPARRERDLQDKKMQSCSKKFNKGIKNDKPNRRKPKDTYDDSIGETKHCFNQLEIPSKHLNSSPDGNLEFKTASQHSILKKHSVPLINLQKFSSSGFHQEFMKKAHEFSLSWRDALKEGR